MSLIGTTVPIGNHRPSSVVTMRAIAVTEPGGADRLQLMDVPAPNPKPGEVLVRVRAAGVNLVDTMLRSGYLDTGARPLIMGCDVSGVVERLGAGVEDLDVGQEVYGYKRFGNGTYAEYAVLPSQWLAPKPVTLSHVEAAAFPCVALTAYQSLELLAPQAGQTLVVTAAAGGVGSIATQIAAARGATVIGTASAHNHGYVRELGAAEVIDYRAGDWTAAVRAVVPGGADAVLEAYGGETKLQAPRALRDGGRIVWITGEPAPQLDRGIVGADVHGLPRRDTLDMLTDLIDRGQLRLPVQQVYGLRDAATAHERVADGHVRGKLVIEIPPEVVG
jgi:NADPH:quinone reductase-like Zn-dependent oxidoreductase